MAYKKQTTNIFVEIIGWYGITAILLAYALASFEVIQAKGLTFQLLNLTGAFGVIAVSVYKKIAQTAVLNIIWAVIAIIALIGLFLT